VGYILIGAFSGLYLDWGI